MREQGIALEHGVDVATAGWGAVERNAVHEDLALVECLEAGDQAQDCGFSTAGWAQKGEELALADIQGEVIHGDDIVKPLRHPP